MRSIAQLYGLLVLASGAMVERSKGVPQLFRSEKKAKRWQKRMSLRDTTSIEAVSLMGDDLTDPHNFDDAAAVDVGTIAVSKKKAKRKDRGPIQYKTKGKNDWTAIRGEHVAVSTSKRGAYAALIRKEKRARGRLKSK